MIKALKKIGKLQFNPEDFNSSIYPMHDDDSEFGITQFGNSSKQGLLIEHELVKFAKKFRWRDFIQCQVFSGFDFIPEHSDPVSKAIGCLTWLGKTEDGIANKCLFTVDESTLNLEVGDVFAFIPKLTHSLSANCLWTMIVADFE